MLKVRSLVARQIHQHVKKQDIRCKEVKEKEEWEGSSLTEVAVMIHCLKRLVADIEAGVKAINDSGKCEIDNK
jgi:hypothetical protein